MARGRLTAEDWAERENDPSSGGAQVVDSTLHPFGVLALVIFPLAAAVVGLAVLTGAAYLLRDPRRSGVLARRSDGGRAGGPCHDGGGPPLRRGA